MKNTKNIIGVGAEAILYSLDDEELSIIVKERIKKDYRISEIDDELRKIRTRSESKILDKLSKKNFPAPRLFYTDRKSIIHMEFIEGEKLSSCFEKCDYLKISRRIGEMIAKIHNLEIIHGDLTTSNIIFNSKINKIFFIDFGLSFFSTKIEDKAVDLHLIRQALESKHFQIYEGCFDSLIKGYVKISDNSKEILKRLEIVEKRGRNRGKTMGSNNLSTVIAH